MVLKDSIKVLKNVGDERTKKLNMLGIYTLKDLIEYFPRDYEDRSKIKKIKDISIDELNTIKGYISFKPEVMKIKDISLTKAKIKDETGEIEVVWFNQPYLKNSIELKKNYIFTGKIVSKYNKNQLESPDYEIISEKELLSTGRIVPVYSSTYKLSQKIFRGIIKQALDCVCSQITEFIPQNILDKYELCERNFAIENIHFPKNQESFFKARKRLVFEEFFLLQIRLFQIKGFAKNKKTNIVFNDFNTDDIINVFNFILTKAQMKVINEIKNDLQKEYSMNRLIQGDVGSGKTAIAMTAIFVAVKNGYQAALMVPTDVLATQHFLSFKNIFDKIGYKCILLNGNMKKKEKLEAYEQISTGTADIVIGTHAVIQENVVFNKLGLAITDEQHRFGVEQRSLLAKKGENPHILVMSATPIPRTLGLILYGDLDISIIDELPPGRQKIDTISVNSTYYERIYNFMKKHADLGYQSFIICPVIEESEDSDLKSVIEYTQVLKNEVFKNYTIECVHGKMNNTIKQKIMNDFTNRKIDIIVSTTVIEVGINVPNAIIMLIENAERFGLSQLHQLRGRVGRGSDKSYCILISDSKSKISKERIKTMTNSCDGFEISEKDLELRGPGDFFGTRQHGIPDFKIANLYRDINIMKDSQNAAKEIYSEDYNLKNSKYRLLKDKIKESFDFIGNSL